MSSISGLGRSNNNLSIEEEEKAREAAAAENAHAVNKPPAGHSPTDGVDTAAGGTSPLGGVGAPKVSGAINFDPAMAQTTLGDLSTLSNEIAAFKAGEMSPSQVDAFAAKLFILFSGKDLDDVESLVEFNKGLKEAADAEEAKKQEQIAELVDMANDKSCGAEQRLEDKLEEMGYPEDQAQQMAHDMTAKGVSPGQQAVMAMEAVDEAPANNPDNTGTGTGTPGEGIPLSELLAKMADGKEEDSEALAKLLLILVGAQDAALVDGQAAAKDAIQGTDAAGGGGTNAGTGGNASTGGTTPITPSTVP